MRESIPKYKRQAMFDDEQTWLGFRRDDLSREPEESDESQSSADNRLSKVNMAKANHYRHAETHTIQIIQGILIMKLHTKLTLGLVSSLFAASFAMAAGPGAKMSQHSGMDCNGMSMMSGDMKMNPVDRADKHLTELNAKLNLTADQQPAWQTFSNHVKEQAKKMGTKPGMMKDKTMPMAKSAPEHMAKMADIMKERAENMAKMADVVKTFYATLTPAQQSAFDKVHESHMAGMR